MNESSAILPDRQEILVDEETMPWVVFNIQNNFFAIEGILVKEILPFTQPTVIPGLPEYFLGIIHSRGQLEAVADTAKVLGLGEIERQPLNRILMIRIQAMVCGLFVQYVHDIIDLKSGQLKSDIRPAKHPEFYSGETEWDGKIISLLNGETILQFLHQRSHE